MSEYFSSSTTPYNIIQAHQRSSSPEIIELDTLPNPSPEHYLQLQASMKGPTVWVSLEDMDLWKAPGATGHRSFDLSWAQSLCRSIQDRFMPTVFPMIGISMCDNDQWPKTSVVDLKQTKEWTLPTLKKGICVKLLAGQHCKEALTMLIQEDYSKSGWGVPSLKEIYTDK